MAIVDQDRRQAVAELQRLVAEGLGSGPPEAFDLEAFLAGKRRDPAAKAVSDVSHRRRLR